MKFYLIIHGMIQFEERKDNVCGLIILKCKFLITIQPLRPIVQKIRENLQYLMFVIEKIRVCSVDEIRLTL